MPKVNSSSKGHAYVLAAALYARSHTGVPTPIEDVDERLYEAIESLGFGEDEVKADLYARLAECLTSTTRFDAAVLHIEVCIDKTRRAFFHG